MNITDKQADELMKWLFQQLKDTKELIVAQAPDIAKEILAWSHRVDMFWIWFGAILAVLGTVSLILFFVNTDDEEFIVGFLFLSVPGTIMLCVGILDLLKLESAPKLYLLDYIGSMLNGHH